MQNSSYLLVFGATVLVFLQITSTEAFKCRGRWANHMCFGGNGKRSWIPPSAKEVDENDDLILNNLLIRPNNAEFGRTISSNEDDTFYPLDISDEMELTDEVRKQAKLEDLKQFLRDYILTRKALTSLQDSDFI